MTTVVKSRRNYTFKVVTVPATQIAFDCPPTLRLPFTATSIILANDSTENEIHYSFQQPDLDGILKACDGPLVHDGIAESQLWFKHPDPNSGEPVSVRVWAWRGGAGK